MISRKRDHPDLIEEVRRHLKQDNRSKSTNEMQNSCFRPDEVLLNVGINFEDGLPAEGVVAAQPEVNRTIKLRFSVIQRVFIEANSWSDHPDHSTSVNGCWFSPTTSPAKSRSVASDRRMERGQSPQAKMNNSKG